MRRRLTIASALAASLMAGALLADHHFMKVVEVFPGTELLPSAQYIVLQMYSPGQVFLNGHSVQVTDPNGTTVGTFTFSGPVANGADQSKILIATSDAVNLFGIAADLTMAPVIQRGGGRVCFNSSSLGPIDCVAWGGYTGSSSGVGTPFLLLQGLRRGVSIRRSLDICGSPTLLEVCDDTDTSVDWVGGNLPTPVNNAGTAGTIPAMTCGNGVLESIEGCDDGNLSNGDGCHATCALVPGADSPQFLSVDPTFAFTNAPSGSSNGNGVLEPGESVLVLPSWRNEGLAARAVDGAMMRLIGPAGATYTRTDMQSFYGMVPPATTLSCGTTSNCFELGVSVPTARPSLHWSASMLEVTNSVSNKNWDLHIGNSFVDVVIAPNPFYRFIETLLHNGVTSGCGGNLYCPGDAVTREQMAVFLLVSKEGSVYQPPPCTTPPFNDVQCSSGFAKWIQELVARGVTAGCGGSNYCPTSPVTREQMSVFLLVTLEGQGYVPPNCTASTFGDVPCNNTGGFSRFIYELVARGITAGCGGGNYCPTNPVTREQMAVFLTTTFALKLYGP